MEELLNKLIEKGRVPFWDKRINNVKWDMQYVGTYNWVFLSNHNVVQFWKSTRELVSKESCLWQFVCENGMAKGIMKLEDYPLPRETNKKVPTYKEWTKQQRGEGKQGNCVGAYPIDNYGYRLIETSLKNEDELEKFLLENIKVE